MKTKTMQDVKFSNKSLLGRSAVALLPVILLAACDTTPLPPWSNTAAQQGSIQSEVNIVEQPAQESAAVAARFPAPPMVYNTPGLQLSQRVSFSSNAEVETFLNTMAQQANASGLRAQVTSIGRSQKNKAINALFIATNVEPSATAFGDQNKPTIIFVGQQHGDEPAGAEALLIVAQKLAQGEWSQFLNNVNVIIVPRANPDGAELSTRVLADGIDLERDHLLLRSPEAQALANLIRISRPVLVADYGEYSPAGRFLTKFNAIQSYDALLQPTTTANVNEFVNKAANQWFVQPMLKAFKAAQLRSQWFYDTSTDVKDLSVSMGSSRPDASCNVNGLKGIIGLEIDSRGVGLNKAHIQRRVQTHVVAAESILRQATARAADLAKIHSFVLRESAAQSCRGSFVVETKQTLEQRSLTMLDPSSGQDQLIQLPWKSSFALNSINERKLPCGYILDASEKEAVKRLQMFGVTVMKVAEAGTVNAQQYQQTSQTEAAREDERQALVGEPKAIRAHVSLKETQLNVPVGSYYIPMGQPLAKLIAAALEPDTQSSYFANRILHSLTTEARVIESPTLIFDEI